MTFAKACREADKKQRRKPKDPRIARLRKLMADDVSLEQAHAEISTWHLDGRSADSALEALMYSLRFGVGALGRPDTLRRLAELSDTQTRQVAVRVQKFKPHIAPAWTATDVEVLLAAWSRVRGQSDT
jgi:hypothetical protein